MVASIIVHYCIQVAKNKLMNFFVKIPYKILDEITMHCDEFLFICQYQSNQEEMETATNASLLSSAKSTSTNDDEAP